MTLQTTQFQMCHFKPNTFTLLVLFHTLENYKTLETIGEILFDTIIKVWSLK
jgi:hypothetical protein